MVSPDWQYYQGHGCKPTCIRRTQSSRVATPEPRLVGTSIESVLYLLPWSSVSQKSKAPTVTRCDWIGKGYQRASLPRNKLPAWTAAIERAANFARLAQRCSIIIKAGPSRTVCEGLQTCSSLAKKRVGIYETDCQYWLEPLARGIGMVIITSVF